MLLHNQDVAGCGRAIRQRCCFWTKIPRFLKGNDASRAALNERLFPSDRAPA